MGKKILVSADLEDNDINTDRVKSTTSAIYNNDLYFYNDVTHESSLILNKSIIELSKQLLITQINLDLPESPVIKLHINSDGGEIFGALSVVDKIKRNKVPIHSYSEGLVASASTLISICCHKRYISKHSIMLIHQVRSWFEGTHENFKDENYNLDILSDIIRKIYLSNTKFNENDLNEILKRDIYLNANDAIKYGLADEII